MNPELNNEAQNTQSVTSSQSLTNAGRPKTWKSLSIISLFFFLPFSILALVNSSKVEKFYYQGDTNNAEKASRRAKRWAILAITIGFLMPILYGFFRTYVAEPFVIKGSSMAPTYTDGKMVLVNKVFNSIQKGDVVLFYSEEAFAGPGTYIKRVIGLPGDEVKITGGSVYINGEKVFEPYIKGDFTNGEKTVLLNNDEYYVLGDNREPNASSDSREFGPIKKSSIKGIIQD